MSPKISILIPVYKGTKYLDLLVKYALDGLNHSYEVLISLDYCNQMELEEVQKLFSSNFNIRIYSHQQQLGMNSNYEFIIKKAIGKWVLLIGQDDFIIGKALSEVIDKADEQKDGNKINLITCERAYFYWDKINRSKIRYAVIGNKKKFNLTKNRWNKILYMLGIISFIEVPFLYTGNIYSKLFLDHIIKTNLNDSFSFPVPDVSSSALTNAFNYKVLKSPYPFTIVGTSLDSTGLKIHDLGLYPKREQIPRFFRVSDKIKTNNTYYDFDSSVIYEYPSHRFYQYLAIQCHSHIYSLQFNNIICSKHFFDWILGQSALEIGTTRTLKFWSKYRFKGPISSIIFFGSLIFAIIFKFLYYCHRISRVLVAILRGTFVLKLKWSKNYDDIENLISFIKKSIMNK